MRLDTAVTKFQEKERPVRKKQTQRWSILLVAALFFVAFVAIRWQEASPEQGADVTISQDGGEHSGVRQICEDSCTFARNGICEDGRDPGESEIKVFCDLGTDCFDCGPWVTEAKRVEGLPKDNVKALVDKRLDLFIKSTATEPSFLMPYTNHKVDNDVSYQMHFMSVVEGGLTALWKGPLEQCCNADPSHPGLVLDVGGNFGWYALYAAKMGCRVISWEPIPHFREYLQYGVVANNLTSLIEIRGRVVSSAGKEIYEMKAPETGNWGTASIDGRNILLGGDELKNILVTGEGIDDVVAEDVCILKVDVEGFEADVFDSAKELFKNHVVHNVFMEYSPFVWEGSNITELMRLSGVLSDLLDGGYNIRHVMDRIGKHENPRDAHLPLVKKEHLLLDRQDMEDMAVEKLGCSKLSAELKQKYTKVNICHHVPFATHPKSFRSEFMYNTNIWAIRDEEDSLPKDSVVGVLKPGEPLSQYFTTTGFGMGGVECSRTEPRYKLRARCPCTNETFCGEEQQQIYAGSKTSWGIAAFPDE